jgi:hypothetical protein
VKEDLFYQVSQANHLCLQGLCSSFLPASDLYRHAEGVMDVMFITSCFNFPVRVQMGDLFWTFANEFIKLKVHSGGLLNSLLRGLVLPQTVIILPATSVGFKIDPLLPPIKFDVTISGYHGPALPDGTRERTILHVEHQTFLLFQGNVRMSSLSFVHTQSISPMPHSDLIICFHGWERTPLEVIIHDVTFDAGVSIFSYETVRCNHVLIRGAKIGMDVLNANRLFITGDLAEMALGKENGFDGCNLALRLRKVNEVTLGRLVVSKCSKVFDVCVHRFFILGNSVVSRCVAMGSLLMPVNRRASFFDFAVSLHFFAVTGLFALLTCCVGSKT